MRCTVQGERSEGVGVGRRRVTGTMLAVTLVVAGLAGCNGNSGGDPEPTLPTVPSTTTTTIDVSKVPATIDVPYVQAVMNALDQRTGDAVRVFVAQRGPNKEWYETFRAVFDDPAFSELESDFGRYAADKLRPLRQSPENPTTTVKNILDASSNCVLAEVERSYGPIFTTPPGNPRGFIQLRSKKPERDPANRNSTAWALVANVNVEGANVPADPCK
jgi:hypothetical protein